MPKLKKRDDGYYRAWYQGKQFLGKTEAEARSKRDEYKYEHEHGIERVKPKTVYEYACEWLPLAKASVDYKSYNLYARTLERMTNVIGDKWLNAVTPLDAMAVWKQYAGLSKSFIDHAHALYVGMFDSAIENGYCTYNPFRSKTSQPQRGITEHYRVLTDKEILLIKTVKHRTQPCAMLMLYTGLRRAEMLDITNKEIHDGRVWVDSAVHFKHNKPVSGRTKTESSVRSIPIFDELKPYIENLDGYIAKSTKGEQCTEMGFRYQWKKYMEKLSEEAGEQISFCPYNLRTTFVTMCRDNDIDIHTVMNWCGHSNEKMILQVYDKLSERREKDQIDKMNSALKNSSKTVTTVDKNAKNKGIPRA